MSEPPRNPSDDSGSRLSSVAVSSGPRPVLLPTGASWIGSRLGKYLLTSCLGKGGMGVVYRAEDSLLKRQVAVKLLPGSLAENPEAMRRFLLEARAAALINHPNVVAIHEVDQYEQTYYIVMELVEGGSAQDFLDAQGPFDWPEATQVLADVCRGLKAAHAAGLIHRDIKPANIMHSGDGVVKLADFGLAKTSHRSGAPLTQAGQVVGTPDFMSPEQCRNDDVDERTDIYSLGATYFALLTGRPPFRGREPLAVMFAHCSTAPPAVRELNPNVPAEVAAIVERALAKARTDRHQSAAELFAALETVLKLAPSPAARRATHWTAVLPATPTPSPDVTPVLPPGDPRTLLAPAQAPDELGRMGHYRVLKVLGEGGMGVVFLAQDTQLERPVALKVMKADRAAGAVARQRFLQEAKAAAKIQHEHIVTIYQVGEDRGIPFLAMQMLKGEPLDARLKRVGRLEVAQAVRIAREVAEGLAAAHEGGLIHRDIKPANIWLESAAGYRPPAIGPKDEPDAGLQAESRWPKADGRVKILDFGLARKTSEQKQHLTQTGVVMGTPGYMAPEQAKGGVPLTARCDLFSLGCVLYHMLTGREPFRREDMMATLLALALETPPPIRQFNPEVPAELVEVVNQLLAKDPADRPESARKVVETLTRIELGGTAQLPALPSESARTSAQERLHELGLSSVHDTTLEDGPFVLDRPDATSTATPSTGLSGTREIDPLREAPAPAAPARLPPGTPACPCCGSALSSTSQAWCLSCGWVPEGRKREAPAAASTTLRWLWVLLGGTGLVLIVSSGAHFFLFPKVSMARIWWSTGEFGLGLLLLLVGHVWAFISTLYDRDDHTIFNYVDPTRLWYYMVHLLPKTRIPLWLTSWGLVAGLCAIFLTGGLDHWIGDPTHRMKAQVHNEAKASDFSGAGRRSGGPSEGELASKDRDPNAVTEPKRLTMRCDVIGYTIDDKDGAIDGLIIAVRRDGELKLAGVLQRGVDGVDTDAFLRVKKGPPGPSPTPAIPGLEKQRGFENAQWLKEGLSCEVDYLAAKEDGSLDDPVFKGW